MRKLLVVNLAVFVVLGLLCSSAFARLMERGDAAIAQQAMPAVVNISTWKAHPATEPNGSPRRVKAYASGFIIDSSGIIVTNKHVVDDALDMYVIFSDGDRAPARLLAAAAMLDLALLKVDVGHSLPTLKWGDSDALQVGDSVLTIGNPLGLGMSVSAGIVSALNRNLQDTPFDNYIQTDAALNHGNSGGPLIDHNGDVVGIDTALYNPAEKGGFIGIGFAIPSGTAEFATKFLLAPNHPRPGWIGVTLQDMTFELAEALGVPAATGAIVSTVDPLGPAGAASLRPGDVLEKIDGVKQGDSRAFMRSIVKIPVGARAQLTIWRDGKREDVAVTIAEWPDYMPAEDVTRAEAVQTMMIAKAPDPGIRLAPITDAARKQYGIDAKLTGVLVSSVESDCEARDLGIVAGDVITDVQGQPVVGPDDVRRAVQAAHEEHHPYIAMLLQTKKGPRWVSLSISGDAGS
jgi:serine protease Do